MMHRFGDLVVSADHNFLARRIRLSRLKQLLVNAFNIPMPDAEKEAKAGSFDHRQLAVSGLLWRSHLPAVVTRSDRSSLAGVKARARRPVF